MINFFFIFTSESDPSTVDEKKDVKRPRLDTGKDIFTQLTCVLDDTAPTVTATSPVRLFVNRGQDRLDLSTEGAGSLEADTIISHISDPAEQVGSF